MPTTPGPQAPDPVAPDPPALDAEAPDLRLVVADMDGTLLDAGGRVPDDLWPLLERMRAAGVVFCPASGRQYATLLRMFERAREGMVFIAENGGYVVRDDAEVSSTVLDHVVVDEIVKRMRVVAGGGTDLGVVVCGKQAAYVERTDRAFLDHVDSYYASLRETDDLVGIDDEVVKVAVFAFAGPEAVVAPALSSLCPDHQVVVSGKHWVDVMVEGVHKGVAVRRLQETLGVGPAQTAVFGDYLNDLEMLDEAVLSYAMANAHPRVLARARHRAPANTENGVVRTVAELLDRAGA